MANTTASDDIEITVTHHRAAHSFLFPSDSTIVDLTQKISTTLSIPPASQKFLIAKFGLLKHPFPDPPTPLSSFRNKKIQLLAPTSSDLSSLTPPPTHKASSQNPVVKPTTAFRRIDRQKAQDEATYTFHTLIPLPYLPNPSRSLDYLARLRDDAGIKAAMRKHKFSVGVLTEMNPAEHTTHESKTLGLNRNRGEVIELRLRTDAYDGYRDYKTIRKTLCHELAHNVFGEHDRKFWDLTKEIEKEVDRGDWRSGGHALTSQEFYNPGDGGVGEHVDGGGWEGGEFVLGGTMGEGSGAGLSRREVLARAAEERVKRQKEVQKESSARTGGSAT